MKVNYSFLFVALSVMVFLVSCNDLFEEDIEKDLVQLIAPSDQVSYEDYLQTFWWKKVEGATSYSFQLVEGTFDQPLRVLADSNVHSEKFQFSLSPGAFQWRVKAFNNGYETNYTTRSLTINDAPIDDQVVNIKSPLDGEVFFSPTVSFDWDHLFGAERYILEADTITGNFSGGRYRDTIEASSGSDQRILRNLPFTSGSFQWRIAGLGADSRISKYSSIGRLVISPIPPVLIAPTGTASPVDLAWRELRGIEEYVVTVRDSSQKVILEEVVNGVARYSFTAPSGMKKFSWVARGKDKAGVWSEMADFQNFEIR